MSYYIVSDTHTGKDICQCALLEDAQMMVALNPASRAWRKVTHLNDQVIDVESIVDHALPGQVGLPPGKYYLEDCKIYRLPEHEGIILKLY